MLTFRVGDGVMCLLGLKWHIFKRLPVLIHNIIWTAIKGSPWVWYLMDRRTDWRFLGSHCYCFGAGNFALQLLWNQRIQCIYLYFAAVLYNSHNLWCSSLSKADMGLILLAVLCEKKNSTHLFTLYRRWHIYVGLIRWLIEYDNTQHDVVQWMFHICSVLHYQIGPSWYHKSNI